MKKIIFGLSLYLFASMSYAQQCAQTGNSLNGLVGVDTTTSEGGERIFAQVTPSGNDCGCNIVRFLPENVPDIKATLAVLLTAQATGNTVRVDYADRNNCDSAFRIYSEAQ